MYNIVCSYRHHHPPHDRWAYLECARVLFVLTRYESDTLRKVLEWWKWQCIGMEP